MIQQFGDSLINWYLELCGNREVCEAILFDLMIWGIVLVLCAFAAGLWAWALERDINEP